MVERYYLLEEQREERNYQPRPQNCGLLFSNGKILLDVTLHFVCVLTGMEIVANTTTPGARVHDRTLYI